MGKRVNLYSMHLKLLRSNLRRWNSKFNSKLIKTILSNSDSIKSSLASCGFGSLELSTHEKQTLGEIPPVLDV